MSSYAMSQKKKQTNKQKQKTKHKNKNKKNTQSVTLFLILLLRMLFNCLVMPISITMQTHWCVVFSPMLTSIHSSRSHFIKLFSLSSPKLTDSFSILSPCFVNFLTAKDRQTIHWSTKLMNINCSLWILYTHSWHNFEIHFVRLMHVLQTYKMIINSSV